jgi:hypothetical protein
MSPWCFVDVFGTTVDHWWGLMLRLLVWFVDAFVAVIVVVVLKASLCYALSLVSYDDA